MTPPGVRGQAESLGIADQRRVQMLTAALEIISERGYADTRIADVAERSGVSPALVIYYYKTKEQLLTEAIRHYEDTWYKIGQARMASTRTAAARLEEFIAIACLPQAVHEPGSAWRIRLDFWAQATRNEAVASVRRTSQDRWHEVISALVRDGQRAGEFRDIDVAGFASCLSALLDGLTVQLALADPAAAGARAFELAMRFVAGELGFTWSAGHTRGRRARAATVDACTN
ncbi:MAG: TetR family transcriptional regulator C-terminal domain-containing protein [Actinobacteria bacterium]|nr:TetR family transcriptional regulator C-terminal domain-containing protein [Actinomycetota bacterium]